MRDGLFGRSEGIVSRRKFLAASGSISAITIAGCSETNTGGGEGDLSGEVVVKGSSTVFPISDVMAQRFMEENQGVNVTVDSTGSGGGFENHFCPGDADINGASRLIKPEEEDHCAENDVTPVEMQIASDAVTMAVSPENDWVDCLSFDEMAQIWQEGGAETWQDINDEWPDEEFVLYGPDTTSGTFDWFTENVLDGESHRTDYEPTEDDNIIVEGIEDDQYAIGYFGYAYYAENEDRVKALEVKENEDDECAEPSLDAAKEGTYPLARPLFVYPSEEALEKEEVYAFMEFYIENSSADWIADEIGYVPASQDIVDENMSTLEGVSGN